LKKIILKHESQITSIVLNNDAKRNAFDSQMSNEVINAINEATTVGSRVIVISANSSHGIFSAGHDLSELNDVGDVVNDPMFKLFDCISNCSRPIIAKVDGAVYAGALHLLMVCDMVYATTSSKVVITANKMGIPFSLHEYNNWLLVMGIHKVKELFFTAAAIDAKDAYNAGIFNSIFDTKEELTNKINTVCNQVIDCSAAGIANTKLQLSALARNVVLDYETMKLIEQSREHILKSCELKSRIDALLNKINNKKSGD
jgi:enoyl-CoA hydratase/carnithine racemase